jgi:hypothetical protein
MTKYLEIIDIEIPVVDMYAASKYPSPGLYLNKVNNQLICTDGTLTYIVGMPGIIINLPTTGELPIQSTVHPTNERLLANSMLKLAAIMKNPELAMGLIND